MKYEELEYKLSQVIELTGLPKKEVAV